MNGPLYNNPADKKLWIRGVGGSLFFMGGCRVNRGKMKNSKKNPKALLIPTR